MKAWRNDPLRFDAVRARYVRRLGCAAFTLLAIWAALAAIRAVEQVTQHQRTTNQGE